ncbi:MAG: YSC84-related protein [Sandaracinaceae bacterium]
MTKTFTTTFLAILATLGLALGCASAPETRAEANDLETDASASVNAMVRRDPSLGTLIARSPGYVVFPEIGQGGLVGGGSAGTGVVYEGGVCVGYATLNEGTVGAQIGGRVFAELIVFETPEALERLKSGDFDLTANASATFIESGAAASAHFEDGTVVFIDQETGAMAEASVGGQSLGFQPRS